MKILVLSDTHRDLRNALKVLEKIEDSITAVLFCGDHISDMRKIAEQYKEIMFFGVIGNCDHVSSGSTDKTVVLADKNIFLTHGHLYNVKGTIQNLCYKAMELSADIVVYGHTHSPYLLKQDNILYLNPGSITEPRSTDFPTYGIIDIEDGNVTGSIVQCFPHEHKTMKTL